MFAERLETIRSVCERLQLQPNRQKLRIKNKHHVITSRKPKHARFQSGVLINYQVIVRLSVKMAIIIWLGKKIGWVKIYGRDYRVTSVVSPFLYVCYVKSSEQIYPPKIIFYVAHA